MADLLGNSKQELLLGNEAITRGLFEAGVKFASTYPGTPSSEVGNLLEELSERAGMYFEFSSNEKTAVEVSAAAASSGVRSFVFMKHVGLNVAADPLMTLAYAGVRAGMLVMSADDPSAHSSQNEQDNRYYATLALIPMVEPSTPQEAKDFVAAAYEVSEKLGLPVLYRTTTRVNHARGIVTFGKLRTDTPLKGHFEKDDPHFVNIPAFAIHNRVRLLEKNKQALALSETSPLNRVEGSSDVGIITSGVSYNYVKEYVAGVSILKLGFTNPVPEQKTADFIRGKKFVIVVEELEPYLEDQVLRICAQHNLNVPVHGKRDGVLPREWEFSPDTMRRLKDLVAIKPAPVPMPKASVTLPGRPPSLCAGCPHRGMYAAVKKAVDKTPVVYCSDIGCYTLGVQPPFRTADFIICMGGGAGAAGGFAQVTDQKPIAFIGDSTFFHSGVPPLTNALFNHHNIIMVILDNRTTAMTGHQPNPGTGRHFGGVNTEAVDIAGIVKGLGVQFIRTVNPYDVKNCVAVMKDALVFDGVAVVISKCPCPLLLRKEKRLEKKTCVVDKDKCIKCYTCLKMIACPALIKRPDGTVETDPTQCIGCGMCASVCPKEAIGVRQ
ncbi:MAG: indolepyruvate ferredoxin oxidoreductase subunit alpha [Candidatus Methanomethylophilus sp.]|nr:indolepyruvate ferredoxin oxidoreductase subunit alpha [Methanomethylophilus sp.]MDD3232840.1 indolepyruvate ferredoxin oxidoreductase subunit alpha [Methanomethylophilus sp.]MDD4668686.1 indolepyruvate ferredoxin oxidoreductase subunit alpha [Methanomethylophilus sp.]